MTPSDSMMPFQKGIRDVAEVGTEIRLHRDDESRADSREKTREDQDNVHVSSVSLKELIVMFLCDSFVHPPETRLFVLSDLRRNRGVLPKGMPDTVSGV